MDLFLPPQRAEIDGGRQERDWGGAIEKLVRLSVWLSV